MTIAALSPLHATVSSQATPARETAAARQAGADFSLELGALERDVATTASRAPVGKGAQHGTTEPLQAFEGFVLRTFVEAMLPKENTAFFGSGTAGDIWRSMLAERIGDEIAASGGIGIADILAKDKALDPAAREALMEREAKDKAAGAAVLPSV